MRRADSPTDDQITRQIRALFAVAEVLHDPDNRDLRRASRHHVDTPVWIYGYGPDGKPFYSQARATNVGKTGALLLVNVTLACGDEILISKKKKSDPIRATVARIAGQRNGWEEVGVAFHAPHEEFSEPANVRPAAEAARSKLVSSGNGNSWKRQGPR